MDDKKEVDLTLLSLSYERQVSRAHTIFSSFWDIFFGIMIGVLGLMIALKEVGMFDFNKYDLLIAIIILFSFIGIIMVIAYYKWFNSQIERKTITTKIKNLV